MLAPALSFSFTPSLRCLCLFVLWWVEVEGVGERQRRARRKCRQQHASRSHINYICVPAWLYIQDMHHVCHLPTCQVTPLRHSVNHQVPRGPLHGEPHHHQPPQIRNRGTRNNETCVNDLQERKWHGSNVGVMFLLIVFWHKWFESIKPAVWQ